MFFCTIMILLSQTGEENWALMPTKDLHTVIKASKDAGEWKSCLPNMCKALGLYPESQ